jgi:hypothetical protein
VLITVNTINSQISPQLSSQLDLLEAEMMITQSDEEVFNSNAEGDADFQGLGTNA